MIDLNFEEVVFESYTMSFSVRADDARAADLVEDAVVEYHGQEFYIFEVGDERDESGVALKTIKAEAGWMRLAERRKPGTFQIESMDVRKGLDKILNGTPWTIGEVTDSPSDYSLDETDATVLGLIWKWAKITSCEVSFDSTEKTVSMVPTIGSANGLAFRYGSNLLSVSRTVVPPNLTRLYLFGRNELTIADLNGGEPFLEDFSHYTAAGLSEEVARERYTKEDIIYDDSFIEDAPLMAYGQSVLASRSQSQVFYSAKVVDLSAIIDHDGLSFRVGDTVNVWDEPLGIDIPARVRRTVKWPDSPDRDTVELVFGQLLLPGSGASASRPNSNNSWELFSSRNEATPRQVRQGSSILNRLRLRTTGEAEWVVGFSISGVGVGTSIVTLESADDEVPESIWDTKTFSLVNGQEFTYNFTFARKEIPSGTYTLVARAHSDTAGAGINVAANMTNLWVLARGTTRQNVTLPDSVRYDYTGSLQTFVVPDDISEILVEAHGAIGGGLSDDAGYGGKVVAKVPVVAGATLHVYVGGSGGYPNGGAGGSTGGGGGNGGAGGGSSDVRPAGAAITSAYVVAAGGGGAAEQSFSDPESIGGAGGFYAGTAGEVDGGGVAAAGATQTAGGSGLSGGGDGALNAGGAGQGSGNPFDFPGGGGGGGLYGGEGGRLGVGGSGQSGGGGGSGWADASVWDLEYQDGENSANGFVIISWEVPEEA